MSLRFEGSRTQYPSARLRFHNATEGSQLLHKNNTVGGINDDVTMALWFKLSGPVPTSLDNNYKQNFFAGGYVQDSLTNHRPAVLLHYGSTSLSSAAPTGGMRFFYDRCMAALPFLGSFNHASLYSNIVYPVANTWNLLVVRFTPNNVDGGSNVGKIFLNGVDITGGQTSMGTFSWVASSDVTQIYFGMNATPQTLPDGPTYFQHMQGLISDFGVWAGAYWSTSGTDMFNMFNSRQRFNTFYPDKLKIHFVSKFLTDATRYSWFGTAVPTEVFSLLTNGTGGLDFVNPDEPCFMDDYYVANPLSTINLLLAYYCNNIFYGFGDH